MTSKPSKTKYAQAQIWAEQPLRQCSPGTCVLMFFPFGTHILMSAVLCTHVLMSITLGTRVLTSVSFGTYILDVSISLGT